MLFRGEAKRKKKKKTKQNRIIFINWLIYNNIKQLTMKYLRITTQFLLQFYRTIFIIQSHRLPISNLYLCMSLNNVPLLMVWFWMQNNTIHIHVFEWCEQFQSNFHAHFTIRFRINSCISYPRSGFKL